jgi:drug/metabolite transporter (DMT)-like permease
MAAGGAMRDAFLSAVVALGLFGPLVGLVTTSGEHGLSLTARPVATAVVVLLVFFGRLLILSWRARPRREATRASRAFAERVARSGKYITPVLQLIVGLLIFHEPLPPAELAGFALVWLAIVIFTWDALRSARRTRPQSLGSQSLGSQSSGSQPLAPDRPTVPATLTLDEAATLDAAP